jgi:hypothetical protein
MAKIRQSNLDNSIVTGLGEVTSIADGDYTIVYDTSAGALKKVSRLNYKTKIVSLSSVSPTSVTSGDGTGNYTFTLTGTNFVAGTTASLINTSGSTVNFDTVTIDSSTQITAVIAKSSMPGSGEPYDVKVTGADTSATLTDQINIDQSPVFVTASGTLGSAKGDGSTTSTFYVNATDPESAGNVTFELQSGSLPPNFTLTNTAAEGGTAVLSGNPGVAGSYTLYTFTLRAVDAASNTSSRTFSIAHTPSGIQSFTSSGTFSVPTGVTSADVLLVAGGGSGGPNMGGGGGAGGLIYRPAFPVTPGGTVTVTVGCGGPWPGPTPGQDSVFGTLTAKGGGSGGGPGAQGAPGGSGGGSAHVSSPDTGGTATQPTQPGDSGTYGFGNNGGGMYSAGPPYISGGGGGAGAAGSPGPTGTGGNGRAYTIADGTTPVYYAGGGGGRGEDSAQGDKSGGQGGGGSSGPAGTAGQANKGGGGGAGKWTSQGGPGAAGPGGKGIVIVSY